MNAVEGENNNVIYCALSKRTHLIRDVLLHRVIGTLPSLLTLGFISRGDDKKRSARLRRSLSRLSINHLTAKTRRASYI